MTAVLLVDSASLWFRAFHGVPTAVRGPDGRPVNAVRGFLDTLSRLLVDRRPRGLVACLDLDWRPSFRVAALPGYKAGRLGPDGREAAPELLGPQIPVILDVLAAAGLASCGHAGAEADDVIAALCGRLAPPLEVVTGDRDLFQLAGPGVRVLYAVERMAPYDAAAVAARYAIPVGSYADFALLRGDPSDGLPGVAGIGAKTAARLLCRYRSVEGLLAAARRGDPDLPAPTRVRVLAAADYLAAAETVVRLRSDLPGLVAPSPELPARAADSARLVGLVERYGLAGPVRRLAAALGWPPDGG